MINKNKKRILFVIIIIAICISLLPLINMIKNHICSSIMLEAIEEGNISKLEKTLTIGNPDYVPGIAFVDVICDSYYKKSPLQLACYKGDIAMVELLIEKGADVNYVKMNAVYSPLISAIQGKSENDLEIVKYLIEQGADVNYSCNVERPVISWLVNSKTISENGLEILKCLVNAGADPKKIDHLQETLLWKHNDIIKYFVEECDYSVEDGGVIQQYCRGINSFSTEIFELLIQNGADIYETDKEGNSAVDYLIETTEGDTYWVEIMESIYQKYHSQTQGV